MIDDLRIHYIRELITPEDLMREYPCTAAAAATVAKARAALHGILHRQDNRLAVVIGPCSIHDVDAAMEYATRLNQQRERLRDALEIVIRVYFEKPRTTVGWKGLINDPDLDGSFRINQGLRLARGLSAGHQPARIARRLRIPGHDHAAVHRRWWRGRDRRTYD